MAHLGHDKQLGITWGKKCMCMSVVGMNWKSELESRDSVKRGGQTGMQRPDHAKKFGF